MTAAILTMLYYEPMLSILCIANKLSWSIPSVSKQIKKLRDNNIIIEQGYAASTGGRKAMQYRLNPALKQQVVSLTIDQFYMGIALSNLSAETVLCEDHIAIDLQDRSAAEEIMLALENFITVHQINPHDLLGIGISMPGFVNTASGLNESYSSNTALYNLKDNIQSKFNVPTVIDNDSRCVTRAELKIGSAGGFGSALVINVNWGVGLGILVQDELFTGVSGFAGEFSHIPLTEGSVFCSCGKMGCLEMEASLSAAIRNMEEAIANGASSMYTKLRNEYRNKGDALVVAAQLGDRLAIHHIGKIAYLLGKGIAILIHILNPQKIVISGRGAEVGYLLLPHIQAAINEHCIPKLAQKTQVEISGLHKKAQQLGTTALVIEKLIPGILQQTCNTNT
ncbi:hypothetical protein BWD42_07600 [Sphingobacterium sp. CZ-UAM]|nr:hypothetical protein BWD42_07600 [Sphingobacterium sp. CZ-UAM]